VRANFLEPRLEIVAGHLAGKALRTCPMFVKVPMQ